MRLSKISIPFSLTTAFFIILYLFTLIIALRNVLSGSIPFWYDPARDLFLGLENLHKPTLIGPPSGITGVFYGPYWIWMLSIGLLVSRDPRIVDLLVLTIPYFILFPLILYKMKNIFGIYIVGAMWLLFAFSCGNYTTFIWNPHFAPLLLLGLVYLFVMNSYIISKINLFRFFIAGFIAGLLFNFHISFGVGVIIGSIIFILLYALLNIYQAKNKLNSIKVFFAVGAVFFAGIIIAFVPYIGFEIRHGFQQSIVLLHEITGTTSSVLLSGLSNIEILEHFFGSFSKVLFVPATIGYIIFLFFVGALILNIYRHGKTFSTLEIRLFLVLSSISFAVLAVYVTAKNPVWEYHFIATEVLWLLWIGLFLKKVKYAQPFFFIWVGILCFIQLISFTKAFSKDPFKESTLALKEHVVETIYKDSSGEFAVFAYNPAIYTFDYDYIFDWKGHQEGKKPVSTQDIKIIYLIIPKTSDAIFKDFVRYKTEGYYTSRIWRESDGTTILKREKDK
jgi:hypothetical protein